MLSKNRCSHQHRNRKRLENIEESSQNHAAWQKNGGFLRSQLARRTRTLLRLSPVPHPPYSEQSGIIGVGCTKIVGREDPRHTLYSYQKDSFGAVRNGVLNSHIPSSNCTYSALRDICFLLLHLCHRSPPGNHVDMGLPNSHFTHTTRCNLACKTSRTVRWVHRDRRLGML